MYMKEENNLLKKVKKHKIEDRGMFTWKFKMAAIFVKFYNHGLGYYRLTFISDSHDTYTYFGP